MKEKYLELMEKILSAYSDLHISRYFDDVKENGLTEHGFPRLTANIGILIAHGRRRDLFSVFLEMMEFCCRTIPKVKAANDFSVREIICCLWEIERSACVDAEFTRRWRAYLAEIEPTLCYDRFAVSPDDSVRNWALFTAVSEYFRQSAGLCDSNEFIELQLLQQQQWFDENGMYKDNTESDIHQPIVYDIVPRGLLAALLNQGYRGRYYEIFDSILKKTGIMMLDMQSANGEIAFGGRSNQFLHNEAWIVSLYEYEAKRYLAQGNTELAVRFKTAIAEAVSVIEYWLEKEPISHIKNRFPTETKHGCERYAYFDKYMITAASNLYIGYLICDETVSAGEYKPCEPTVTATSRHFHKLFLKNGEYSLEFDTDADPHYDANGLGRIHRRGAPSAVCMSCPCPKEPRYTVGAAPMAFSLCSAVKENGEWIFGADESCKYEIVRTSSDNGTAAATLICLFENEKKAEEDYEVKPDGVSITVRGEGEIGFCLPAFRFDGEKFADVCADGKQLSVFYEGWVCRYVTDGEIIDLGKSAPNRNGFYSTFVTAANGVVHVEIQILKVIK